MPWTVLLLIALFLPVPASAIIYQCRDDRGTLFLTDDPDNLPPGCQDRQTRLQKKDLETPPTTPSAPAETPPQRRAPAEERTEDEEKSPQPSPGQSEEKR